MPRIGVVLNVRKLSYLSRRLPSLLDLEASLKCRVNPDDVMAIFDVFGRRTSTSAKTKWTYMSSAKCWFWSIAESVVGYLPTIRR